MARASCGVIKLPAIDIIVVLCAVYGFWAIYRLKEGVAAIFDDYIMAEDGSVVMYLLAGVLHLGALRYGPVGFVECLEFLDVDRTSPGNVSDGKVARLGGKTDDEGRDGQQDEDDDYDTRYRDAFAQLRRVVFSTQVEDLLYIEWNVKERILRRRAGATKMLPRASARGIYIIA